MSPEPFASILETVIRGEDLGEGRARGVMDRMMAGEVLPTQVAALVAALRTKRESVDELTGMVRSLRAHATSVHLDLDAVDNCGVGGDRQGTFNISTAAALVAAGAGCHVAKHGNRAISSRCGSADVLEALGVAIAVPPYGVRRCVVEARIGFMFAPTYHPAWRHVQPTRRELGVRTVFNVLGPLANPARVEFQALGVGDPAVARLMAAVLERLDLRHGLVFAGPGGLDEVGLDGPSQGYEVTSAGVRPRTIDPAALGFAPAPVGALRGETPEVNAAIISAVLAGEPGPARDVVVLNAAVVILVAERVADLAEGVVVARRSIDEGAARVALDELVRVSNLVAAEPGR